jgi:hypothetical protein
VHFVDPATGLPTRSVAIDVDFDHACLCRQLLACNGSQLLLLRSSDPPDARRPSLSATLLDLSSRRELESRQLISEPPGTWPLSPQALCYDVHNNLLWALDGSMARLASYRNVGLPPRVDPPPPEHRAELLTSPVPLHRLQGLALLADAPPDIPSDIPSDKSDMRKEMGQLQAARLLAHLDRLGQPFAPPDRAGGSAFSGGDCPDLCVSSGGRDDSFNVRFLIRGHTAGSSIPGSGFTATRGVNVLVLKGLDVVEARGFDTAAGAPYNELLYDFVSRLPDGTTVLVATREEAASGLSALGRKALRLLGADAAVDRLSGADILVMIGRKGAQPGAPGVIQKIVKRGSGVAVVRQRAALTTVPLSVEPTPQVRHKHQ